MVHGRKATLPPCIVNLHEPALNKQQCPSRVKHNSILASSPLTHSCIRSQLRSNVTHARRMLANKGILSIPSTRSNVSSINMLPARTLTQNNYLLETLTLGSSDRWAYTKRRVDCSLRRRNTSYFLKDSVKTSPNKRRIQQHTNLQFRTIPSQKYVM